MPKYTLNEIKFPVPTAYFLRNNRVKALAEHLAKQDTWLNGKYWKYETPDDIIEKGVRDAILAGHEEVVRLVLDAGFHVNTWIEEDLTKQRKSLLDFAIQAGRLNLVKLLVEKGAEIYIPPYTPDHSSNDKIKTAVLAGHSEICEYLLQCGANALNVCYNTEFKTNITFLTHAVLTDNNRLFASLVEHGADIQHTLEFAHQNLYEKTYLCFKDVSDTGHLLSAEQAQIAKSLYDKTVFTCMDYAFGCNFKSYHLHSLKFLEDLDVSQMNFIGVSLDGKPITREILQKYAKQGADKALLTLQDLESLPDGKRKEDLLARYKAAVEKFGVKESKDQLVNMVPLYLAAEVGDLTAVEARVLAMDINLEQKSPLVAASSAGHVEIVKHLIAAHEYRSKNQVRILIKDARTWLAQNEKQRSFILANGRLEKTSLPFENDQSYVVVVGKHSYHQLVEWVNSRETCQMPKKIKELLTTANEQHKSMMLVANKNNKVETHHHFVEKDNSSIADKVMGRLESAAYQPMVFCNERATHEVLVGLIPTQYQDLDQFQTHLKAAIESAKKNKHDEIVELLTAKLESADKTTVNSAMVSTLANERSKFHGTVSIHTQAATRSGQHLVNFR